MKYYQLIFFKILISINLFSQQKIGLVYNINPEMGYVFFKGVFKATPIIEEKVGTFNMVKFLEEELRKHDDIYSEVRFDFNFREVNQIGVLGYTKDIKNYLNQYCEKNNLDGVLAIVRNEYYRLSNPLQIYHNLGYNLGIATFSIHKNRAILYYNFIMFFYMKEDQSRSFIVTPSYKTHKFENQVYNDNYLLNNNQVMDYYLPVIQEILKSPLNKTFKKEKNN